MDAEADETVRAPVVAKLAEEVKLLIAANLAQTQRHPQERPDPMA